MNVLNMYMYVVYITASLPHHGHALTSQADGMIFHFCDTRLHTVTLKFVTSLQILYLAIF